MKKTLLSLFCALALVTGLLPSAAALEGEALRAADTLASLGLIQSAEAAADYRLDDPVSRAQAAMLLVRLATKPPPKAPTWSATGTRTPGPPPMWPGPPRRAGSPASVIWRSIQIGR